MHGKGEFKSANAKFIGIFENGKIKGKLYDSNDILFFEGGKSSIRKYEGQRTNHFMNLDM